MTIHNRLIKTAKCLLALLIVGVFAPTASLSADAEKKVDAQNTVAFSNQNLRGQDKNYRSVNSWTPYFTWVGNVQDNSKLTVARSTMGVGFLYFAKVRGNLKVAPSVTTYRDSQYKIAADQDRAVGSISYNRTPVYEWMYGYKIFSWLSVLFSIQNQSNISIQTKSVPANNIATLAGTAPEWGVATNNRLSYQFRSQLSLNSLMLRANFELPWVMVWKNWAYVACLGVGVGPGWQSWTNNAVYTSVETGTPGTSALTFVNTIGQKYSANCVFEIDTGIRMKPACLTSNLSILWGCKFIDWGQARSIGKLSQQGPWQLGLFQPFKVRTVYSFAPYLGFQWNF